MRATEHYLEVIDRLNPKVNAILTVTADMALEQAHAADKAAAEGDWLGILHGVPMTVKDCLHVAGVRTTFGSGMYRDNIANSDSEVVRRIRRSGPVFLGKTNLAEFCYGATTQNDHFGNCLNPWDLDRVSGGSSGGAGAATAAGMCRIAFGSDTGGSIRNPASFCGVAGIRPTVGRIPNTNALALSVHADTIGMLAYNVTDVARGFAAIAGYDPADPLSEDVPVDNFLPTLRRWDRGCKSWDPQRPSILRTANQMLSRESRLHQRSSSSAVPGWSTSILKGAEEARVATMPNILAIDMADLYRDGIRNHPEKFGAEVLRRLKAGEPFSGLDYAHSLRILVQWKHQFKRVFKDIDLILFPTTPIVAPKFANAEDLQKATHQISRNNVAIGYAGLPCLTVPVGFDFRWTACRHAACRQVVQ